MKKILADIRTVILATGSGVLFGFFINKGMVFIAPTIRQQMLFNRFAMLKMFMAAVGTSMLSVSLLEICAKALYAKILNGYIDFSSRRNSKSLCFCFQIKFIVNEIEDRELRIHCLLVSVVYLARIFITLLSIIVLQAKNNQLHHFFFDVYRIYCI